MALLQNPEKLVSSRKCYNSLPVEKYRLNDPASVCTYSSRVRQKMRTNRLDISQRRAGQRSERLEWLLATGPALGQTGQGEVDDLGGCH